ncbi:MAG TPA: hypothetical protein VKF62_01440, partial [Planctomycetota bacterium]|nr:hypothetical protein [Planctomycetota bacterium]
MVERRIGVSIPRPARQVLRPCAAVVALLAAAGGASPQSTQALDAQLAEVLEAAGFTGEVEASLEARLGRP